MGFKLGHYFPQGRKLIADTGAEAWGNLILWTKPDAGNFFIDTSGTIPASSSGEKIAFWKDSSPYRNHLKQFNTGLRPLYRPNWFGGFSAVQFVSGAAAAPPVGINTLVAPIRSTEANQGPEDGFTWTITIFVVCQAFSASVGPSEQDAYIIDLAKANLDIGALRVAYDRFDQSFYSWDFGAGTIVTGSPWFTHNILEVQGESGQVEIDQSSQKMYKNSLLTEYEESIFPANGPGAHTFRIFDQISIGGNTLQDPGTSFSYEGAFSGSIVEVLVYKDAFNAVSAVNRSKVYEYLFAKYPSLAP